MVPMTYGVFQQGLKAIARAARVSVENLSSHSLRRGGATYLAALGVPLEEIKKRGDWASWTVLLYLSDPLEVRREKDILVAAGLDRLG